MKKIISILLLISMITAIMPMITAPTVTLAETITNVVYEESFDDVDKFTLEADGTQRFLKKTELRSGTLQTATIPLTKHSLLMSVVF